MTHSRHCESGIALMSSINVSRAVWVDGMVTPNRYLIWLSPMMRAAPVVKPEITLCERKFAKKPSRSTPIPKYSSPTRTVTCT